MNFINKKSKTNLSFAALDFRLVGGVLTFSFGFSEFIFFSIPPESAEHAQSFELNLFIWIKTDGESQTVFHPKNRFFIQTKVHIDICHIVIRSRSKYYNTVRVVSVLFELSSYHSILMWIQPFYHLKWKFWIGFFFPMSHQLNFRPKSSSKNYRLTLQYRISYIVLLSFFRVATFKTGS